MNYINKLCLCIVTLVSFSSLGMIRQVIRDEHGFRVFDGQQECMVKPYFVDSLLKRMNHEQVQRFIELGNRIRVIRLSDGEYRLQAMVPVKGGGPILACLFYSGTKAVCYGSAIAAATAAVGATGGGALLVAGAAEAAAVTGAGVAAAGIAAVGGTTAATTAVGAAAATGLSVVALVESASVFMGALGAAIPFL
jgi:hypothetical protein